jgi:phage I-like protein
MATNGQKELLEKLYEELGQEPEDIDNMTTQEASRAIKELLEIKKDKRKFEAHEDDCYYYK